MDPLGHDLRSALDELCGDNRVFCSYEEPTSHENFERPGRGWDYAALGDALVAVGLHEAARINDDQRSMRLHVPVIGGHVTVAWGSGQIECMTSRLDAATPYQDVFMSYGFTDRWLEGDDA